MKATTLHRKSISISYNNFVRLVDWDNDAHASKKKIIIVDSLDPCFIDISITLCTLPPVPSFPPPPRSFIFAHPPSSRILIIYWHYHCVLRMGKTVFPERKQSFLCLLVPLLQAFRSPFLLCCYVFATIYSNESFSKVLLGVFFLPSLISSRTSFESLTQSHQFLWISFK